MNIFRLVLQRVSIHLSREASRDASSGGSRRQRLGIRSATHRVPNIRKTADCALTVCKKRVIPYQRTKDNVSCAEIHHGHSTRHNVKQVNGVQRHVEMPAQRCLYDIAMTEKRDVLFLMTVGKSLEQSNNPSLNFAHRLSFGRACFRPYSIPAMPQRIRSKFIEARVRPLSEVDLVQALVDLYVQVMDLSQRSSRLTGSVHRARIDCRNEDRTQSLSEKFGLLPTFGIQEDIWCTPDE
jgi:hypothetical protein